MKKRCVGSVRRSSEGNGKERKIGGRVFGEKRVEDGWG